MSPSPFPTTPRALRRWLAAALMLAVWLTAAPVRCDPVSGHAWLAAAARLNPAWPWLQLLWSGRSRTPAGRELHATRAEHPPAARRQSTGSTGAAASDTGGSSGTDPGGTVCGPDPNGCHPGP